MKVFLALLIVMGMGENENYTYTTGGVSVIKQVTPTDTTSTNTTTSTTNTTYIYNSQTLTIQQSCRQVRIYDPALNSKVDPTQLYFLMKLTCNDQIRAKDYYDAEKNGNSTIQNEAEAKGDLIKYECVMNVTFDDSNYCCCPDRNYDLKLKTQRWLLSLLYQY